VTVLDSPPLADAIERAAEPALARAALERVVDAHPALAEEIAGHDRLRDGLIALACASRSLSNAVVGDPRLLDPLRNERDFGKEHDVDDYARSWAGDEAHSDAGLRRWKRRELLRIAARDLLGIADLRGLHWLAESGRDLGKRSTTCNGAAGAARVRLPPPPLAFFRPTSELVAHAVHR
jgi:glutamine synthetase adenylyltransferase